jgi:hypothetical protein
VVMDLLKYPLKYNDYLNGIGIHNLEKLSVSHRANDENVLSFEITNDEPALKYIENELSIDSSFYLYMPKYNLSASSSGWQQYKLNSRNQTIGHGNTTPFQCVHKSYDLNNYKAATFVKNYTGATFNFIIDEILSTTGANAVFSRPIDHSSQTWTGSFAYNSEVTARRLLVDFVNALNSDTTLVFYYLVFDNTYIDIASVTMASAYPSYQMFFGVNLEKITDQAKVENGVLNHYYGFDGVIDDENLAPGSIVRAYKDKRNYIQYAITHIEIDFLNPENNKIEILSAAERLSDSIGSIKRDVLLLKT